MELYFFETLVGPNSYALTGAIGFFGFCSACIAKRMLGRSGTEFVLISKEPYEWRLTMSAHSSKRHAEDFIYPWQIPQLDEINDLKIDTPSPTNNPKAEEIDEDDRYWSCLLEEEIPLEKLPDAA